MMIESMAGKSASLHGICHDATPFTFSEDIPAINFFGDHLVKGRTLQMKRNRYAFVNIYLSVFQLVIIILVTRGSILVSMEENLKLTFFLVLFIIKDLDTWYLINSR